MLLGDAKVLCWPSPADRPEMYFVLISLLWRYEITSERRRAREKISLGAYSVCLQLSHLYLSVQCWLGYFFALVKNKDKPQGGGESGQHCIGVWEQRRHLASLRHPVSPSYHSKSVLFFQPGFLSPSSQHAFPLLTLFLPTLARKRKDLTNVARLLFSVELENGGWGPRLEWIQKIVAGSGHYQSIGPWGKRSLLVLLYWLLTSHIPGGTAVGEHPWRTSVSEDFTPGLGWVDEHTPQLRDALCRTGIDNE